MSWIFSEQMLVYYISVFRDAFWPNGKLAPPNKIRSAAQSQETKQKAQQKLLENIPGKAWLLSLNIQRSEAMVSICRTTVLKITAFIKATSYHLLRSYTEKCKTLEICEKIMVLIFKTSTNDILKLRFV